MMLSEQDRRILQEAKFLLENPSLASRMTHVLGTPIEKGFEKLPPKWKENIQKTTQEALMKALDVTLWTMDNEPGLPASRKLHKLYVIATGAVGGAFGLPALAVELPISTAIMLRSIADIARSEGEDLSKIETQLACLQVFALGGTSASDDAAETGYFAVRAAFAKAVSEATESIVEKGLSRESAPAILRFLTKICERVGITVSQKAAAQAVPLVGAAGGALINALFIDHFQDIAWAHFTLRRLERKYGSEDVKEAYDDPTGAHYEPAMAHSAITP